MGFRRGRFLSLHASRSERPDSTVNVFPRVINDTFPQTPYSAWGHFGQTCRSLLLESERTLRLCVGAHIRLKSDWTRFCIQMQHAFESLPRAGFRQRFSKWDMLLHTDSFQ